ncbi:RNA polymerase sigma factor [Pengzhenrongella phosphoraccumulans]|uniref:RNA polymerase sigma factor n=1 Tax=Pengzhenrongella phosphoraccumulans TaxID=3114394 RepID=UPI00388D73B8
MPADPQPAAIAAGGVDASTPPVTPRPAVDAAISLLAREESGRIIALLAHRFGDVDLADEAVHEALIAAVETWPERGIPDNPAGWLRTAARNRAIDRIRRATSARRRLLEAAPELLAGDVEEPDLEELDGERDDLIVDEVAVRDEQLRLMLLCCHPALDVDAQVALTLRLVGGLSTPEIASAFLLPTATLAQRIVRAKRKIQDARIPLSIPADLDGRVGTVLTVLYLIFNEGYLSRGAADAVVRVDLAQEAIRLTRLLVELVKPTPEAEGLLALELFQHARVATRVDDAGDLVLLERQDRTRWDLPRILEANRVLATAMARGHPGVFQVEALIAAQHANARTAADTDWPAIVGLYAQLEAMTGSPVVRLNRAVAVAMADGPHAGLALLDPLDGLDGYHLLHATRGELLLRADRGSEAEVAFGRALMLATNPAEVRHLERRVAVATADEVRSSPHL